MPLGYPGAMGFLFVCHSPSGFCFCFVKPENCPNQQACFSQRHTGERLVAGSGSLGYGIC